MKICVYNTIKLSIMNIKHHSQIGTTTKWIHLFSLRFKDGDLTNDLIHYLEWNCDNYKY